MRAMRGVFVLAVALLTAAPAFAQNGGAPEGWTLSASGMQPPNKNCTAAKLGPEVNTRLMRNERNQMILITARGNWNSNDPAAVTLSIDGVETEFVMGMRVGPLMMVVIDKPAMEARLKAARTLDWNTPWGDFHADVAGLGEAYDKVEICRG
jgi:hypothetical protein